MACTQLEVTTGSGNGSGIGSWLYSPCTYRISAHRQPNISCCLVLGARLGFNISVPTTPTDLTNYT